MAILTNEDLDLFVARIDELRKERKLTLLEVERQSGLASNSIYKWRKGCMPRIGSIQKLAKFFGVSISYLMGETENKNEAPNELDINTQNSAFDDILNWDDLPLKLEEKGAYFAVKMNDDSMLPRIAKDDILLVQQQVSADTDDIVLIAINGNEVYCRKLINRDDGILLQPLNADYQPLYCTNRDLRHFTARILGRVIKFRSKL